jgi:uncharacterized protein YjbI with pentapeptide repeats
MLNDFSHNILINRKFTNQSLVNANFTNCDIRGADFSDCNLSGSDFSNVRAGISNRSKILLFTVSLILSLLAGYIAMLGSQQVQRMLEAEDQRLHYVGMIVSAIIFIYFGLLLWKGFGNSIKFFLLKILILTIVTSCVLFFSGIDKGQGAIAVIMVCTAATTLFFIGTFARAVAGALSFDLLFVIVAVSGSLFGKTLGGGIGTIILAILCAFISKKTLNGAKGLNDLRIITLKITNRFGTSFNDANLIDANFSDAKLNNTNFNRANLTNVKWNNTQKKNCLEENIKLENV